MESKLDHNRVGVCCAMTLGIQFMFEGIHKRLKESGGDVSKLMLTEHDEETNHAAFKEMIISVISAPFDVSKLTRDEKATLNDLTNFIVQSESSKTINIKSDTEKESVSFKITSSKGVKEKNKD